MVIDEIVISSENLMMDNSILLSVLKFIDYEMLSESPKNYSLNDLVGIINQDIVLVARILKRANAAINKPVNHISDIKLAITRIGPKRLRDEIYDLLSKNLIEKVNVDNGLLNNRNSFFYKQMLGYAKTAESVIKYCIDHNSSYRSIFEPYKYTIYYMALMQDIGMILLDRFNRKKYQSVLKQYNGDISSLRMKEAELYEGHDHLIIGASVLKNWNFPDDFVEVINTHHETNLFSSNYINRYVIEIIMLSNMIYKIVNSVNSIPWYINHFQNEHVLDRLSEFCSKRIFEKDLEFISRYKFAENVH